MMRADVSFYSDGRRCAAWLYLPPRHGQAMPCVVMAHGTTGTMDLGLARYAERFAGAGLAVLVFEYRHFGASEGQPRQLIRIGRQLADWRAAIAFARSRPQVDPARVALWGTSLSGGHVVTVAASDPRIAAVVAQVPFMGIDASRSSPRSGRVTATLFTAAVGDALGSVLGRPPVTVAMVGEPGATAVFSGAEDNEFARQLAAGASRWRNELTARSLFSLVGYRPVARAARVAVPLLVCVAEDDTATSVRLAVRAARRAPRGELLTYPGGHFAAYLGDVFERMVHDELEFFVRHLALAATG